VQVIGFVVFKKQQLFFKQNPTSHISPLLSSKHWKEKGHLVVLLRVSSLIWRAISIPLWVSIKRNHMRKSEFCQFYESGNP
jgi:hypothetical protein